MFLFTTIVTFFCNLCLYKFSFIQKHPDAGCPFEVDVILQAARARLSSAEIALFMNSDPAAIDYRAASLQQQVQTSYNNLRI